MSGMESLDWEALVPRLVYPTKLWVIEAILWIGQPLSATELEQIFDEAISLSSFTYHITTLVNFGILEEVSNRKGRGSVERFYGFSDEVKK